MAKQAPGYIHYPEEMQYDSGRSRPPTWREMQRLRMQYSPWRAWTWRLATAAAYLYIGYLMGRAF